MEKFYGFGRKYVEDYHRKTGRSLFLHLRQIKREVENPKNGPSEDGNVAEPPAEKVCAQVFAVEHLYNYFCQIIQSTYDNLDICGLSGI